MFLKPDTPEDGLGTAVAVLMDEMSGKIVLSLDQRLDFQHWRLIGGRIKSRDFDPRRPFDGQLAAHNAIKTIVKRTIGLSFPLRYVAENQRGKSGALYVFAGMILHTMRIQQPDNVPVQLRMFSDREILSSDQVLKRCKEAVEEALAWKG
ncbi:MAG: hypothetical protein WCT45_02275 [Candidatus Paceibacterota bacterium]|jgi:hypothetical protein